MSLRSGSVVLNQVIPMSRELIEDGRSIKDAIDKYLDEVRYRIAFDEDRYDPFEDIERGTPKWDRFIDPGCHCDCDCSECGGPTWLDV